MTSEGSHIFASPCESPPVGKHRSMVLVGSLVTKQTFSCSSSLSTSLPVQLIFDESAYDTGSQNMPWSPLLSYTDINDKRNSITLLFLFFFIFLVLFFCSKDLHLPEPMKQDQSEIFQKLSVSQGSSQKVETAKVSIFNYLKSSFLSIQLIIVLIK